MLPWEKLATEAGLSTEHEDVENVTRIIEEFRTSVLPKTMMGHLLLQNAGLTPQERTTVLASTRNKLDLEDIKSSMEDNDTLRIVVESDTDFDDEVVFGRYDRYESFKEKLTWYEAESSCATKGGHLPSISSEEENFKLSYVAKGMYWVGGRAVADGVWKWSDGSQWGVYSNWMGGRNLF